MRKLTLGYISDLHMDFYCREYNPQHPKYKRSIKQFTMDLLPENPSEVDVLIIAGDTGHRNDQTKLLLLELKQYFKQIVMVTGNHDLYLINDKIGEQFNWDSFAREKDIMNFCKTNGIHYLDGDSIEINQVTIAGLGMFWDTSYYTKLTGKALSKVATRELYVNTMNDIKYISNGTKPEVIRLAYGGGYLNNPFSEVDYSAEQMTKLNAIQKADIMVTHYIPVPYKKMPPYYKEDITTTFYTFDGQEVLNRLSPSVWVFGHTHVGVQEVYDDVLLVCNPKGYPSEGREGKIKVLEVELND